MTPENNNACSPTTANLPATNATTIKRRPSWCLVDSKGKPRNRLTSLAQTYRLQRLIFEQAQKAKGTALSSLVRAWIDLENCKFAIKGIKRSSPVVGHTSLARTRKLPRDVSPFSDPGEPGGSSPATTDEKAAGEPNR